MTREDLIKAAEAVERASEVTVDEEAAQTFADHAEQIRKLAERPSDPDHGRLARHENQLQKATEKAGAETVEHVEAALGHIRAFRETIEGV